MDDQGTKWHRNIAENFNRLSRAHERYRQQTTDYRRQTDGLTTTYSEHELEFTFANKQLHIYTLWNLYDLPSNCQLLSLQLQCVLKRITS